MKLRYEAFSPADDRPDRPRESVAKGELELPDDASDATVIDALVNAVESQSALDPDSQVRVTAHRDDEVEPHYWHTWDHGGAAG